MDVFSNGSADIVPLTSNGLKGAVSRFLPRAETFMVILDDTFYRQLTEGWTIPDKLKDKVYIFTTEDALEAELISKVGFKVEVGTAPPDVLLRKGMNYTENADFGATPLSYTDEKVSTLENDLKRSKAEVARLQKLLESNGVSDDIKELVATIKDLNAQIVNLEDEKKELKVNSDKAVTAEIEANKAVATAKKALEEKALLEHNISTLNTQIAEYQVQVKKLTQDIEDYKADIADRDLEINKVRGMLADLGDRGTELAKLTADLEASRVEADTLREQLSSVGADSSKLVELTSQLQALTHERDVVKIDLETANKSLETLQASLDELRDTCKQKEAKVVELTGQNSELTGQVTLLTSQINDLRTELDKARNEMSRLLTTNETSTQDIQNEIKKYQDIINGLNQDKAASSSKIASLSSELVTAKSQLQTAITAAEQDKIEWQGKVDDLSHQVESANADIEKKKGRVQELESELVEVRNSLSATSETANKTALRVQELESKLTIAKNDLLSKDSQLSMKSQEADLINQSLADQKAAFDKLNESLIAARQEVQDKNKEIRELTLQIQTTKDEASINSGAYERLLAEKNQLDARVVDLERSAESYRVNTTAIEERLTATKAQYDTLMAEKLKIEADKRKLDTEIVTLRAEMVDVQAKSIEYENTKNALESTQRELARVSAERTSLKGQLEGSTLSGLNSENMMLKSEIEKLRKKVSDTSELENSRAEVLNLRNRVTALEGENHTLRMTSSASGSSWFVGGGDIMPNGVFSQTLRNPPQPGNYTNFKLFVQGSSDSGRVLYETLTRACSASTKRILILDLTTDSNIDSAFGIKSVPPPLNWLKGEADFRKSLAVTRFSNVNVISTALAYVNKLYFARVDWASRLADLNGFADLCIIVLDCLSDYVVKAMYNTFSQLMESYIVINSTPTNLRAGYMNVLGMAGSKAPLSTVLCVKYDSNNQMIQQLFSLFLKKKFRARALLDSEVLTL